MELLRNREVSDRFRELVESNVTHEIGQQEEGVDALWKRLRNGIIQAAEGVLGEKPRGVRSLWFDEECAEAIRRKNDTRQRFLTSGTRSRREEYKEARKDTKKLLRKKKRTFTREKLKHIEQAGQHERGRIFYKEIKSAKEAYTPQCKFIRTLDGFLATSQEAILQRWVEHFTNTFSTQEGNNNNTENTQPQSQQEEREYSYLPTLEDIALLPASFSA